MLGIFLLVLPVISAFNASGEVYSIGSYHIGSAGAASEGTDFSGRNTLDYQQGGNENASSTIYSVNLGWFKQARESDEELAAGGKINPGGGTSGSSSTISGIQFDIKILDIETPINLGESFDFMYFVKGVGSINNDVTIDFWIEKDEEVITSGSDIIFLGTNEEKIESATLFLPTNIESGQYKFIIKVSYENTKAEAHRSIELTVVNGEATIDSLFDVRFLLEDIIVKKSDDLFTIAIFENFGLGTTTIDLTFIILDENGEEVYRGEESLTVETEEILRKSFEGLNLDAGKYTLILQTLYGANVRDEFRQEFEIEKERIVVHLRNNWFWYLIGVIIFSLLVWIIILTIKLKKKKKFKKITKKVKSHHRRTPKNLQRRFLQGAKKPRKTIHQKIEKEVGNL